jgi:hypothetical protein
MEAALRQILDELQSLRREVAELKSLLGPNPSSRVRAQAPVASVPEWNSPEAVPNFSRPLGLHDLPVGLAKRLEPILQRPIPQDPRQRAQWLLELCENTEDFLRYEGDDWPAGRSFLADLQERELVYELERITPSEGEPLDARLHLVLQTLPSPEKRDQVARCARPGYIFRGEILRRAEVVAYL